jgi:hypothetical protein
MATIDSKHLLEIAEECIKSYNPQKTTVDAHGDDFLGIEGGSSEVFLCEDCRIFHFESYIDPSR